MVKSSTLYTKELTSNPVNADPNERDGLGLEARGKEILCFWCEFCPLDPTPGTKMTLGHGTVVDAILFLSSFLFFSFSPSKQFPFQ